jgi:hypothetical protein
MKLPIACLECMTAGRDYLLAAVEFRDDGRYEVTCPEGHKNVATLQEQKFELLFEIGAYAIRDGYYREAVTSFASSLERFYEFFIKAALFEKGIDAEIVERSLKLANLAERLLGAFVLLYTSDFRTPPTLLESKRIGLRTAVKFRNNVVHMGKIPSRKEALEFGQIVLDLVRPMMKEAQVKYPKGVQETVFDHVKQARRDEKESIGIITMPTTISLSRTDAEWTNTTLEQRIKGLPRWS